MTLLKCPDCRRDFEVEGEIRAILCPSCGSAVTAQSDLNAALSRAKKHHSPYPNTTVVKPGMKGRFFGRNYDVRGRVVKGVVEEGVTYPWHEFQLVAPDGDEAWLAYDGGVWTWMKPFLPRNPIGPQQLVDKRAGSWLTLEDKMATVTQNSNAKILLAEGGLSFRAEKGDRTDYLDANSGKTLYSVEWRADEIEFFRGQTLAEREVLEAFDLHSELRALDAVQRGSRSRNTFAFVCLACAFIASFMWLGSGPETGTTIHSGQAPITSIGAKGVRFGPFSLDPSRRVHTLQVFGTMTQASAWVQGVVESAQGDEVLEAQGDFWDESGYDDGPWHEWKLSNYSYFVADTPGPYYIRLYAERDTPNGAFGNAGYVLRSGVVYPNYLGWFAFSAFSLSLLFFYLANKTTLKRWSESLEDN
ncbi:MAG TPA: DUF4178 domain-containing protein [Abditibacteriaceae bacterium]|jgi:hypothetical protein